MLQKNFSIVPDVLFKTNVYAEAAPNYLAVWSNNDLGEMEAFEWFQWELNADTADACFEEALQISELLSDPLHFYFNFPHISIFPSAYWKESISEHFISLQYGAAAGSMKFVHSDCSKNRAIDCRIAEKIIDSSSKYFKTLSVNNAWSQIIQHVERHLSVDETLLTMFFYPGSCTNILHIGGELHFIGHVLYQQPESVLFSILNILKQHQLTASDTKIKIAGMLEASSPLFIMLYQYLGKIEIASYDKVAETDAFSALDSHILLPFAGYQS